MEDLKQKNDIELKLTTDETGQAAEELAATGKTSAENETETLPVHSTTDHFPSFGKQYQVLSLIGHGGMGSVYKVKALQTESIFAIKLLKHDLAKDNTALKRFGQEVKSLSELDHPGLVTMYGHGQSDCKSPYLVLEFLEGKNLSDYLSETKTIEPKRATAMMIQLCEALSHAHKKGIVHRDIKPSNIIVNPLSESIDSVRLLDFGIARIIESTAGNTSNLTQTGDVFGTPTYMSPEQCEGKPIDHRSDVYSLGCVMFEILTGKPPFEGTSPIQVAVKHINDPAPSFPKSKEKTREPLKSLEAVVMRCLNKNPLHRYQSIDELLKDLKLINAGKKIRVDKGITNVDRPKWLSTASAVCVFYCLASVAFVTTSDHPPFSQSTAGVFCMINSLSLIFLPLAVLADYRLLKLHRTMYAFESLAVTAAWTSAIFSAFALFATVSATASPPFWLTTPLAAWFMISVTAAFAAEFANTFFNLEKKYRTKKDKPYSQRVAINRVIATTAITVGLLIIITISLPIGMASVLYGWSNVLAGPAPQLSRLLISGASIMDKNLSDDHLIKTAKLDMKLGKKPQVILQELNLVKDDSAALNIARAEIYQGLNQPEEAIECYRKALLLDPENRTALLERAKQFVRLKDYESAITDYSKLIEIDPNKTHDLYRKRAILELAQGYNQFALADMSAAQASDTYSVNKDRDFMLKAIAYQLNGDKKEAIQNFKLAEKAGDLSNNLTMRPFALLKLGKTAEYKKAIDDSYSLRKLSELEFNELLRKELFEEVDVNAAF
ncbi:MAG: protein kinase [Candidatus Melainabacteria bacterium]|nr:protein kinase [Candidatus Melainabacteria bacterium]